MFLILNSDVLFNLTDPEYNLSGIRASRISLLQHYAVVHRQHSEGENVFDDNDHRHYGKGSNIENLFLDLFRVLGKAIAIA